MQLISKQPDLDSMPATSQQGLGVGWDRPQGGWVGKIKIRQSVRAGCDRPLEMAKGNPLV